MAESARLKREELGRGRHKEQLRWDEEAMRVRHRNMRASAGFLRTKTEPRLYYKPWELRDSEEDEIKRQIENVTSEIAHEVLEYERRKQKRQQRRQRRETRTGAQKRTATQPDSKPEWGRWMLMTILTKEKESRPKPVNLKMMTSDFENLPLKRRRTTARTVVWTLLMRRRRMARIRKQAKADAERPTSSSKSDEHDHGGEELERGQEDDVIY